jgi:hypothetical protein
MLAVHEHILRVSRVRKAKTHVPSSLSDKASSPCGRQHEKGPKDWLASA